MNNRTTDIEIVKVSDAKATEIKIDQLAVEEPLQINLTILQSNPPIQSKNISITMRTPGSDGELAAGFLYTEGIIRRYSKIAISTAVENTVTVSVAKEEQLDLSKLNRHFYTSSSCGVCGKASVEAIWVNLEEELPSPDITIAKTLLMTLPELLRKHQDTFRNTGGLHAAGLFNEEGELLLLREDVGRHNALDKVIGAVLLNGDKKLSLPLSRQLLLLSGRASFELIQKAVMAGIKIVMAVGAPSSLAVQMAHEHDVTLIGFLNATRFNIYSGKHRIIY